MSQININGPDDSGDRTAAAGINLISVIIIVLVLAALAWFLFASSGPVHLFGGPTNINVNPPAQQAPDINVNPPPQQPAPQPTPAQPPAP
jgi:hypothetical protein